MSASIGGTPGQQAYVETMKTDAKLQTAKGQEATAAQVSARATLKEEESEVTMSGLLRRTERVKKTLDTRKVNKSVKPGEKGESIKAVGEIADKDAREFADENSEFQGGKAELLTELRKRITAGDTKGQILYKTLTLFGDFDAHTIDEALRFLERVAPEGELKQKITELRNDLVEGKAPNSAEVDGQMVTITPPDPRAVVAGRNMGMVSREFVLEGWEKQGVEPTDLRKMYHQFTHESLDAKSQYEILKKEYPSFKDLKKVIRFMLHALGKEGKEGGSSIEKGKLNAIIVETRLMQAIYGVYNFFRLRQRLVEKLFGNSGSAVPPQLTFENTARQFMKFISDRFPSADKAKHLGDPMGIAQDINAEIIILSQMRDAVREVSPKNFQGEDHKINCLTALVEALEDLEDELEDLEARDFQDVEDGTQVSSQPSEEKSIFSNAVPQPPTKGQELQGAPLEGQGQIEVSPE